MYIRYKVYSIESKKVKEEIAKFIGMYHIQEEGICYISFDGNFNDLLLRLDGEEYKILLDDIDYNLITGSSVFRLKNIGIEEDYEFLEPTWDEHLKYINKQLDKIKNM